MVSEERAFIENWWKRKFSMPNLPTGDDVIMVSHALELLEAFRGAGDAKGMTGPTEKSFLEAWWLRKFPVGQRPEFGRRRRASNRIAQIHRGHVAEEREEEGETAEGGSA